MRAAVIARPGSAEPLDIVDQPDPGDPPHGHVRVRLRASSLNYHDSLVIGDPHTPAGHVPLADGAGIIESVGPGVTDHRPGDRVVAVFTPRWIDGTPTRDDFGATPGIGLPGYARELVVAPTGQFMTAPAGWTLHAAATLTVAGVTAWRAVVADAHLQPGHVVVILGTGGVATFALQFAKMAGATVVVTSSSEAKLERAQELGADHLVNYRRIPDWGRHIAQLTGGADLVVELGGSGTLGQSIEAARVGGIISLIGVLDGAAGPVPTGALTMKQITLRGIVVGSRRHQQDMVRALTTHPVEPIIDRSYHLDELPTAVDYFRSAQHVGKVVLSW